MQPPSDLVSPRSTVRRKKERGSHDRAVVDAVLDEGLVCHVAFVDDRSTFVLPTAYARVEDDLFLHGAVGNHMLRALADGTEACVVVTLVDGLVLARSAFHHSLNYRSVVLFGRGEAVTELEEKRRALLAIVEHLVPGRTADARPPSDTELRSTLVVRFPIEEGSAKVRTGGPIEDAEDLALPVWAGQLPMTMTTRPPIADDDLASDIPVPHYVAGYTRSAQTPAAAS